jgi:hypothetical protein
MTGRIDYRHPTWSPQPSEARTETLVLDPVVNVRSLGAQGDGVTDDAPVVQKAVDRIIAAGGGTLYYPAGRYLQNSEILGDGANNITIKGAGPEVTTILQGSGNTSGEVFKLRGGVDAYASPVTTLTANAGPGGTVGPTFVEYAISVASSSAFTAGDIIIVGDNYVIPTEFPAFNSNYIGELVRVSSTGTGVVRTLGRLRDSYTTARSASIHRLYPLQNIGLRDLSIVNPAPGTKTGGFFTVLRARNVQIHNVAMSGADSAGVSLENVYGFTIDRLTCDDFTDDGPNNRFGYGIAIGPCEDGLITNCHFRRCRHGITTTAGVTGHRGHARNITVVASTATECPVGFDTHWHASHVHFTGLTTTNCLIGYEIRSRHTTLTGCRVDGASYLGVTVESAAASNVLIDNMFIRNCLSTGIQLSGGASQGYPVDFLITGNRFFDMTTAAVDVPVPANRGEISNNVAYRSPVGSFSVSGSATNILTSGNRVAATIGA